MPDRGESSKSTYTPTVCCTHIMVSAARSWGTGAARLTPYGKPTSLFSSECAMFPGTCADGLQFDIDVVLRGGD